MARVIRTIEGGFFVGVDPIYGLDLSQLTNRLTRRNWRSRARALRCPEGPFYLWIWSGYFTTSMGKRHRRYFVEARGGGDYERRFHRHFQLVKDAIDYANGDDGGAIATETQPYDLEFRPNTYWGDSNTVLANIKAKWRRDVIERATEAGRVEEVPPEIFGDGPCPGDPENSLPPKIAAYAALLSGRIPNGPRAVAGAVDPRCLGGEFLPPHEPTEVTVAHIYTHSVTGDTACVRASLGEDNIRYRVVDDYGWEYECPIESSRKPLRFRELVDFIDSSTCLDVEHVWCGPSLTTWAADWHCSCGSDPSEYVNFTELRSDFYSQLTNWYEDRWIEWLRRWQNSGWEESSYCEDDHEIEIDD